MLPKSPTQHSSFPPKVNTKRITSIYGSERWKWSKRRDAGKREGGGGLLSRSCHGAPLTDVEQAAGSGPAEASPLSHFHSPRLPRALSAHPTSLLPNQARVLAVPSGSLIKTIDRVNSSESAFHNSTTARPPARHLHRNECRRHTSAGKGMGDGAGWPGKQAATSSARKVGKGRRKGKKFKPGGGASAGRFEI